MTHAEQLAAFVVRASYEDLSEAARQQLKIRVLDGLGCAMGAQQGEPIRLLRAQVEDFDGAGHCTLLGGGKAAPDRAAFTTALWYATWTSTTAIWPKVKPAIQAIIWGPCWLLPSMQGRAGGNS